MQIESERVGPTEDLAPDQSRDGVEDLSEGVVMARRYGPKCAACAASSSGLSSAIPAASAWHRGRTGRRRTATRARRPRLPHRDDEHEGRRLPCWRVLSEWLGSVAHANAAFTSTASALVSARVHGWHGVGKTFGRFGRQSARPASQADEAMNWVMIGADHCGVGLVGEVAVPFEHADLGVGDGCCGPIGGLR